MELTVNKIVKETTVEGKWGPQTRTAFKANEYGDKILSAFSKYPLKVGQVLTGEVKEVEKDGKTYLNFEPAKKTASGGLPDNQLALLKQAASEAYNARLAIQALSRALRDCGVLKDVNSDGSKVPDFDEKDFPEDF